MNQINIKPKKTKKSWIPARRISLAMGEGEDVSIFLKRLREIYAEIPFKRRDPID